MIAQGTSIEVESDTKRKLFNNLRTLMVAEDLRIVDRSYLDFEKSKKVWYLHEIPEFKS